MALVACPECKKSVSSSAVACPYCGFPIKEFMDKKSLLLAQTEGYKRTHKNLNLDEESWFILFFVYDSILEKTIQTSTEILKFNKIWFDDTIPSSPLGFVNEWFRCLNDCYI